MTLELRHQDGASVDDLPPPEAKQKPDIRSYILYKPDSQYFGIHQVNLGDDNDPIALVINSERDKLQKYLTNPSWIPPHLNLEEVRLRYLVMESRVWTPLRVSIDENKIMSLEYEGLDFKGRGEFIAKIFN